MDNRAGEMEVFARVAEAGSFAGAARLLFVTPSTVSKLVARMEARIGVRLVERSTRKLALTEEGHLLYERSRAVLAQMAELERDVGAGASQARGVVRVNASVAFGVLGVEPLLPEFCALYPGITVDLSLSDEMVDLYLDRTDVAFRVGALPDSGLRARRIGAASRKIVGAPAYLERHGTPRTVEDLAAHNCLGFNFRRSAPVWPVRKGVDIVPQPVSGQILANNGETVRRLAVRGMGLVRLGDYHVR